MFTSDKKLLSNKIKSAAEALGFHIVRITDAESPRDISYYREWIALGFHGEMGYLERHSDKKSDLRTILPSAQSVICCAMSYHTSFRNTSEPREGSGVISNYAWGDDYHDVMEEKLANLYETIKGWVPSVEGRYYVDSGPVLERSLAQKAGIGWIGKNACVINQEYGSFIFLGEIITNLDLVFDETEVDHCGSCTKCLDACPTEALIAPHQMDARRCIAYLTIEKRGDLSFQEEEMLGKHIFGCDICQEVCPWNDKSIVPNVNAFQPRGENYQPMLKSLRDMTKDEFSQKFKGSPVKRAKYEGFMRNVLALLLKNPLR